MYQGGSLEGDYEKLVESQLSCSRKLATSAWGTVTVASRERIIAWRVGTSSGNGFRAEGSSVAGRGVRSLTFLRDHIPLQLRPPT